MTPEQERLSPVEKLAATHDVDSFECGKEPLDRFLKRFALANQKADSARTYVACRGVTVLAYYSLAAGAVELGCAALPDTGPPLTKPLIRESHSWYAALIV